MFSWALLASFDRFSVDGVTTYGVNVDIFGGIVIRLRMISIVVFSGLGGWCVSGWATPYLTWTVEVTAVPRGDTIAVKHDGRKVMVKLHGIACPDVRGTVGEAARKHVSERVLGKSVTIKMVDSPSKRRAVHGEVFLSNGDRPINEELVAAGLAWWSRPQAPDNMKLAELEAEARRKGRGLWKANRRTSPPWLKKKRRGRRRRTVPIKTAAVTEEDLACNTDHDCVLLPSVCLRCSPCKSTWRPVANLTARHRVRRQQGIVHCPPIRCPSCASKSKWRSARPVCKRGRCTLEGKPADPPFRGNEQTRLFHGRGCADYRCSDCTAGFATALDALLARYHAHDCVQDDVAKPPRTRRSRTNACRRNRDCVFAHHPCRPCPSCNKVRWRRVTNRKTHRRQVARYARRRVKCARCRPCPAGSRSMILGSKAVCIKRQCVAR